MEAHKKIVQSPEIRVLNNNQFFSAFFHLPQNIPDLLKIKIKFYFEIKINLKEVHE